MGLLEKPFGRRGALALRCLPLRGRGVWGWGVAGGGWGSGSGGFIVSLRRLLLLLDTLHGWLVPLPL